MTLALTLAYVAGLLTTPCAVLGALAWWALRPSPRVKWPQGRGL